jgi:Alanyl-tRNA synthetase
VTVGEYDICPCIGAHVANTADVGAFRLVSHEFKPAAEGEEGGVLRLRFKLEEPSRAV